MHRWKRMHLKKVISWEQWITLFHEESQACSWKSLQNLLYTSIERKKYFSNKLTCKKRPSAFDANHTITVTYVRMICNFLAMIFLLAIEWPMSRWPFAIFAFTYGNNGTRIRDSQGKLSKGISWRKRKWSPRHAFQCLVSMSRDTLLACMRIGDIPVWLWTSHVLKQLLPPCVIALL